MVWFLLPSRCRIDATPARVPTATTRQGRRAALSGPMARDLAALRQTYARDGVVFIAAALDPAALTDAQGAYDWSLANPGPGASRFAQHCDATFYQDLYNPRCLE